MLLSPMLVMPFVLSGSSLLYVYILKGEEVPEIRVCVCAKVLRMPLSVTSTATLFLLSSDRSSCLDHVDMWNITMYG